MSLQLVHVPKTGGTSLRLALRCDENLPKHLPGRCLSGPRVGILRNPWARMVSLWRFTGRQNLVTGRGASERARDTGFRRWLLEGEDWLGSDPVDGQWHNAATGRWESWTGQGWQEAYGWPAPPLQRRPATWWLEGVEHVLRTETLNFDADRLLGVRCERRNAAPEPGNWRDLYDAETAAFIEHHHGTDIALGGYSL